MAPYHQICHSKPKPQNKIDKIYFQNFWLPTKLLSYFFISACPVSHWYELKKQINLFALFYLSNISIFRSLRSSYLPCIIIVNSTCLSTHTKLPGKEHDNCEATSTGTSVIRKFNLQIKQWTIKSMAKCRYSVSSTTSKNVWETLL